MAANSRPSVERAGDRDKALETALVQIERQFGKGSVMRLGQEGHVPVEVIPTGSIALDVALGLGGLPRGRIVEIYGPESSGKCATADTYVWTSRGLETIAEVFAHAAKNGNLHVTRDGHPRSSASAWSTSAVSWKVWPR